MMTEIDTRERTDLLWAQVKKIGPRVGWYYLGVWLLAMTAFLVSLNPCEAEMVFLAFMYGILRLVQDSRRAWYSYSLVDARHEHAWRGY